MVYAILRVLEQSQGATVFAIIGIVDIWWYQIGRNDFSIYQRENGRQIRQETDMNLATIVRSRGLIYTYCRVETSPSRTWCGMKCRWYVETGLKEQFQDLQGNSSFWYGRWRISTAIVYVNISSRISRGRPKYDCIVLIREQMWYVKMHVNC